MQLSVFPHDFSPEAAHAVCDVPDAWLRLWRRAALVERQESTHSERFSLLPVVREYSTRRLGDDRAQRQYRFVAYFRQLAVDNEDINDIARLAVFDAEWRNVFGALALADAINDHAAYRVMAAAVDPFVRRRWLLAEYQPLLLRAVQIGEATLGPEHPDVAGSLNNLAELYRAQGRYAEAEPRYQRALAIVEKVLGPEHPNVATILGNYVALLRATNRNEEAERLETHAQTRNSTTPQ